MNKAPSPLILFDSRSAGLARVRLALAKTDSETPWQRPIQQKAIGAHLNGHPSPILSLQRHRSRPGRATLPSP